MKANDADAKKKFRDKDPENIEELIPVVEINQASAQRIGETVGD